MEDRGENTVDNRKDRRLLSKGRYIVQPYRQEGCFIVQLYTDGCLQGFVRPKMTTVDLSRHLHKLSART